MNAVYGERLMSRAFRQALRSQPINPREPIQRPLPSVQGTQSGPYIRNSNTTAKFFLVGGTKTLIEIRHPVHRTDMAIDMDWHAIVRALYGVGVEVVLRPPVPARLCLAR